MMPGSPLLLAVMLCAPGADSIRAYDRAPLDSELRRFAPETRSRRLFSGDLERWGRRPLGPFDHALMLDLPARLHLRSAAAACDSAALERHEYPQEELSADDRGRWRSFLVVSRGRPLDSLALTLYGADSCLVLSTCERRKP